MDRLRNFTTQTKRRAAQSTYDHHSGPIEHQDTPTILPIALDGAVENINSSDYAKRCREIIDLDKALRDLGVHATFDFPRVVVIGGQSSGKSSLVEAVSGINVPRDSGTCTRCPMECTLSSNAESWSCTIEIRREYDTNGIPLRSVECESFGQVIVNKSDVELWVRRAQAAVLNPNRSPSEFYNMSKDYLRELSNNRFSKNVVRINVNDPDATDISFVDLPGLIQNADDDLITTVKDLVEHYIAQRNTLIVIAMPMTDDYENMQAVRLAREGGADPNGNRTIGVLTKPDLLPPGSLNSRKIWRGVLEGGTHHMTHGYYCVLLPDDEQRTRGVTRLQTEQKAEEFFNGTAPWNEISDRTRFGLPNFVGYISSLLVHLIENYLPGLARKVRVELLKCEREYSKLPPIPKGAPLTELMLRITAFCQDITNAVSGVEHKHFVQANRASYLKFKDEIVTTMPDFRPQSGDVSNLSISSCTTPHGLEYVREVIKSCRTWELPKHVPFEATKRLVQEYTRMWKNPMLQCFEQVVRANTNLLEKLLENHFGQYIYLKKYISDLTFKERQRCRDEAQILLTKLLRMENHHPFTQNSDYIDEDSKWYSNYLNQRNYSSTVGSDAWTIEDEIRVMASVQAYFQVSHKRFIDSIPLAIEHELNQNLSDNIRNTVIQTLFEDSQNGDIHLADLLNEDPITASRRIDLEDRISRLQKIMDKLDGFEHLELPEAYFQTPILEQACSRPPSPESWGTPLAAGVDTAFVLAEEPDAIASHTPVTNKKKKVGKYSKKRTTLSQDHGIGDDN